MTLSEIEKGLQEGFTWQDKTVYALTVRDYEKSLGCFEVLRIYRRLLPIELRSMPWLRMLHASAEHGGEDGEYEANLVRLAFLLSLSFKVPFEQMYTTQDKKGRIYWFFSYEPKQALGHYSAFFLENSKPKDLKADLADVGIFVITESDFNSLRELLAEINAVELPDETILPELWLEQQRKLEEANTRLSFDSKEHVWSMANNLSMAYGQVLDLSIYEFSGRSAAIDRDKRFALYGNGNFVFDKQQNPVPDWRWSAKNDNPFDLVNIKDFDQLKQQNNEKKEGNVNAKNEE